ncbi:MULTISPECIES: hypothetical protein [unclassified Streptomyces]|uniref:hypothetical protein n=1 Tax=unclassified Streptomyces TaxID=2593676 RepID=UPI003652AFAE
MNDRQRDEYDGDFPAWEARIGEDIARESASEAETDDALQKVLKRAGKAPSTPGPDRSKEDSPARAQARADQRPTEVRQQPRRQAEAFRDFVSGFRRGDRRMTEEAIALLVGDLDELADALEYLLPELGLSPRDLDGIIEDAVALMMTNPKMRHNGTLRQLIILLAHRAGTGHAVRFGNGFQVNGSVTTVYDSSQMGNYNC